MKIKYRGLRVFKWVYRVIAVLVVLGGIFSAIITTMASTMVFNSETIDFDRVPPNFIPGLSIIATALFIALGCEVFAELLQLFMDTEENTRLTGILLKQMSRNQAKNGISPSMVKKDAKSLLEEDNIPEF